METTKAYPLDTLARQGKPDDFRLRACLLRMDFHKASTVSVHKEKECPVKSEKAMAFCKAPTISVQKEKKRLVKSGQAHLPTDKKNGSAYPCRIHGADKSGPMK